MFVTSCQLLLVLGKWVNEQLRYFNTVGTWLSSVLRELEGLKQKTR